MSPEELESLKKLTQNTNIVIQKSVRGNSVVVLDKNIYISRVTTLTSNSNKFQKLDIPPQKDLNFVLNTENKIKNVLKELLNKGQSDQTAYSKLCPSGSKLGIFYGLAKNLANGCPPFRPILSAIGTPTYNIAKFWFLYLNR